MAAIDLNQERRSGFDSRTIELDYCRKSYRYLRVALVAMVVALLVSTTMQSIDAGWSWLGSLSAYYFTPVHSIFISALVMVGVCLVAIRGLSDPEDIALNLAGMAAPIVALVPTGYPADDVGYENLFEDTLPISAMEWNNVVSLGVTAVATVALVFLIHRRRGGQTVRATLNQSTQIGFVLAALVAAALIAVQLAWGSTKTHAVAAVITIGGLVFVALINSVRHLRDEDDRPTWGHHLAVALFGGTFVFGVTLMLVGLIRLVVEGGWLVLALGVVLTVGSLVIPGGRASTAKFLDPQADGRDTYDRWYLAISIAMIVGGPIFGAWPGTFDHRILWVELAELVPFGVFWVLQTWEYWDSDTALASTASERDVDLRSTAATTATP